MATPEQQMAAMARRQARFGQRIRWFGEQLERGLRLGMERRLSVAAQLLRDKTVINLSVPVRKVRRVRTRDTYVKGQLKKKGTTYTWVDPASRSKPGEFPRADTTRLMKDIFHDKPAPLTRIVGTSLKYGLILEMFMDRSFLRRTLYEMEPVIRDILTRGGPGAGGGSAMRIR